MDVNQRFLADSFDREDLLNRFREAYRKAPEFSSVMPLLEKIIQNSADNLFDYIFASIRAVCGFLEIKTHLVVSSTIDCDHSLKSAERVQAICKSLGADTYLNPVGGMELYSKENFVSHGIILKFLRALPFEYRQGRNSFVPWLSILDVLMFNSKEFTLSQIYKGYSLE